MERMDSCSLHKVLTFLGPDDLQNVSSTSKSLYEATLILRRDEPASFVGLLRRILERKDLLSLLRYAYRDFHAWSIEAQGSAADRLRLYALLNPRRCVHPLHLERYATIYWDAIVGPSNRLRNVEIHVCHQRLQQ